MRGLLLFSFVILVSGLSAVQAQDVLINEMSQGSGGAKEWVELVVRADDLDMRGWELGDNDDGSFSTIVTFSNDASWASVAQGTIIVVYNGGDVDGQVTAAGAPDTDFSDNVVLIPDNNTTFFSGNWSNGGEFDCHGLGECARRTPEPQHAYQIHPYA